MLYKKDTTGKIRTWDAEIKGNKFRTITGVLGGKQITNEWTTCEGKNVGRANETSPEEQATFEAQAKMVKKIKEGYFENIDDVDNSTLIKPMLAHKFEKYEDKIKYPVYSQPKLDGIRCNITKYGMFSRKGEPITSCPHIIESLEDFFKIHPDTILDGELYNHYYKDNFNEIQSLVTKKDLSEENLAKTKELVQYHIYDVILSEGMNYRDREDWLRNNAALEGCRRHHYTVFSQQGETHYTPWILVLTVHVGNRKLLDSLYEEYAMYGFEGQMVRTNSEYQHKRSRSLLKRKEFCDDEFTIIGVEEGKGNRSGMAGRVTLVTKDDKEFGAGIKGGVEFYKELWSDKDNVIGKQGTVEYFNLTPDGIPRFPVFKAVRNAA